MLGLNLIAKQILFSTYKVQAQNTFFLYIQVRFNMPLVVPQSYIT